MDNMSNIDEKIPASLLKQDVTSEEMRIVTWQ